MGPFNHNALGLWLVLLVFGFATLFPDLATIGLPIEPKVFRLMSALAVALATVMLSDYYYHWSKGLI